MEKQPRNKKASTPKKQNDSYIVDLGGSVNRSEQKKSSKGRTIGIVLMIIGAVLFVVELIVGTLLGLGVIPV